MAEAWCCSTGAVQAPGSSEVLVRWRSMSAATALGRKAPEK